MAQTMPPEEWEIVLVDDMSTEDLSFTYRHLIGKINLTHVWIDHTLHHAFKERNPLWKRGDNFENWFHTPAISINVGTALARGETICLCHPEILHASWNFVTAHRMLSLERQKFFIFGQTYLGTQEMNRELDSSEVGWTQGGLERLVTRFGGPARIPRFGPTELYWYTSFLPKEAVQKVGGVDFKFLRGVAGEDDDFKERVRIAGWLPYFEPGIGGFHQDHSDEGGHRDRSTEAWKAALNRNRALLFARMGQSRPEFGPAPCPPGFPAPANQGVDWTARETVVVARRYEIGRSGPHDVEIPK
jgi:hypothetical protein